MCLGEKAYCISRSGGLYPSVGEDRHSAPVLAGGGQQGGGVNALTIKLASTRIGVDDVPFKLNPIIESSLARNKVRISFVSCLQTDPRVLFVAFSD